MADEVTDLATKAERMFRPPGSFFDMEFRPLAGTVQVKVAGSGGQIDVEIDPESKEEIRTYRAKVNVQIFRAGSPIPVAAATKKLPGENEEVLVVFATVPPKQAGEVWRVRVKNAEEEGVQGLLIDAKVVFPFLPGEIRRTSVPLRVLNHAMHGFLDLLGLRIRLDGTTATITFGPDLARLTESSLPRVELPLELPGALEAQDITMTTLRVEARRGREVAGARLPTVKMYIDFETIGPAELSALGVDVADISQATIEVEIELKTSGPSNRRFLDIEPNVKTAIRANLTPAAILLFPVVAFLTGEREDAIKGAKKKLDEELEKIGPKVEELFRNPTFRPAARKYLTEGFAQIAERGHRFHALTTAPGRFVVAHFDPTPLSGGAITDVVFDADLTPSTRPTLDREAVRRLNGIDHIVFLMQENRSFDHLIGYLSLDDESSQYDGLRGDERNESGGGLAVGINPMPSTIFSPSPRHELDDVKAQVADGRMSGFLESFVEAYPLASISPTDEARRTPLSFYTADQVPTLDFLATNYMVCNAWFSSFPGATQPNRFATLGGRTREDRNLDPRDPKIGFLKQSTIFELLSEAGIDWAYYEHSAAFLRFYDRYRLDDRHVVPIGSPGDTEGDSFFARACRGELPAVTFIDPNFVSVSPVWQANDDHPPADVRLGQQLIADIYNALVRQPKNKFAKTLFVITWDEHGGFFDHIRPPGTGSFDGTLPPPDNSGTALLAGPRVPPLHPDGPRSYGVRVPAFVVSPLVAKGSVSNERFEHLSISNSVLLRFLGTDAPAVSDRLAQSQHLGVVLQGEARTDRPLFDPPPPPSDPQTPPGGQTPLLPAATRRSDEEDTFHEAMRTFGQPIL